jgi:hypothetical protein
MRWAKISTKINKFCKSFERLTGKIGGPDDVATLIRDAKKPFTN